MDLKKIIREIPDYPENGILFRDISTIIDNPVALEFCVKKLGEMIVNLNPDYLAAIEARGFIFSAILSHVYKIPMIMVRKNGKLPPPVITIEYDLEYGKDTLEVPASVMPKRKKFVIIDDIIATGGTVNATCELIEKTGNEIIGILSIIHLGLNKIPLRGPVESIVYY